MPEGRRVAVIGGGWAGLAAAIEATRRGARVSLFEMAPQWGGRAREVEIGGLALDNGQHICIGAYTETLRLLHEIGVAESDVFMRTPLRLVDSTGNGLVLGTGPPWFAFASAVLRHRGWQWLDKMSVLRAAAGWLATGFQAAPTTTVAELTTALRPAIREELIDPLCVAALNTTAHAASAQMFLRVLHDALFAGRGSSDLLLPRVSLGNAMPVPAARWLRHARADLRLPHRVETLTALDGGWQVDGERFAGVVLAASAQESARLAAPFSPGWAAVAGALAYAPIVTVYATSPRTVLPSPMLVLQDDDDRPAQFVFDRGQLGGPEGVLAFVISGAEAWVAAGTQATLAATLGQGEASLGAWLRAPLAPLQVVTEKRATFRCIPLLKRPAMCVSENLWAAGDHIDGPYPSTLEGAIRSGIAAGRAATTE